MAPSTSLKLRYGRRSPYVRKVLVTAIEAGIEDRIECVETDIQDPASDIGRDNPLAKIPTLLLADGTALYDSPVICEYLDFIAAEQPRHRPLFPPPGPERWSALRRQALADGIMDASVTTFLERQRDAVQRSDAWEMRQIAKIQRALNVLEEEARDMADGPLTIGTIAIGCALGYLDLRLTEIGWRGDHPTLAGWFEPFSGRPSMRTTMPPPA